MRRETTRPGFLARSLLAGALVAIATTPTLADPAMDPALEAFLVEVQTLSADFTQTLIDADGSMLEESSGTLEVSRPGRFRWIYKAPYEQWLVADGLNVWSYDADLEQVTVKPQATALASTPALLLGGSTGVLEAFRFDGSAEQGGLHWVRLVPLDQDSGFRHVELGFDQRTLSRMVFLDNLEQTTVVTLDHVLVNPEIANDVFVFSVPEDADVVGTPAQADTGAP